MKEFIVEESFGIFELGKFSFCDFFLNFEVKMSFDIFLGKFIDFFCKLLV